MYLESAMNSAKGFVKHVVAGRRYVKIANQVARLTTTYNQGIILWDSHENKCARSDLK